MEMILSTVFGEVITRSINFFINKNSKMQMSDMEGRLRRVLLRAQVIVDEAMGRHITNQAMLKQLGMLRDAMYQGCYTLDTFRYIFHDEDAKDQVVRYSLNLSKLNSLKGLCSSDSKTLLSEQLQEALGSLSSMLLDMEELVVFLTSYPRLYPQPYSMHILLDNCMFGRQMETELVLNFLLHTQLHGLKELDVLPIVGPGKVGKSTLVAHVCKDERVRGHFSDILFLRDHDIIDDEAASSKEGCAIKHQCRVSNLNKNGRLLVVIELDGDVNEELCTRLYSAFEWSIPSGSKIIVTSQSDKIVKFGTTNALTLKYLSHEAYWYFFKMLTFGGMDPDSNPMLTHLAMEIATTLNGSLLGANVTSRLLRDNFDICFWHKVRAFLKGSFQDHVSKCGEHPLDLLKQNRFAHFRRMAMPCEEFVVYNQYQRSSQDEVPEIRVQDVMYGSIKPNGAFEFLVWRSQIPPCYSYVYTCEIRERKPTPAKRKRSMKDGATRC